MSNKKIVVLLMVTIIAILFIPFMQVSAYTDEEALENSIEQYEITLGDETSKISRKTGDVNLDGIISSRDAGLLVGYIGRN